MYKRDGLSLPSLLHGGEQEEKRAGRKTCSHHGNGQSSFFAYPEAQQAAAEQYQTFADVLMETLAAQGVDVQLNGDPAHKLPHILNLRFRGQQ